MRRASGNASRRQNVLVLALAIWLWLPSLAVLATDQVQGLSSVVALLLFSAGALAAPLIFIARVRTYFLVCAPLALLVAPYCYLTLAYGSVPGDALVEATLHTHWAMSVQVMLSFGWLVAWIPASFAAYLFAVFCLDPGWSIPAETRKRLAALLLTVTMAGMVARQAFAHSVRLPPLLDQSTVSLAFPSGLISSLSRLWLRDGGNEAFMSVNGRAANPTEPLLVVLVIGDSVRSDHLGINGYRRATTPRLAQLGSELLSFNDVAACANWTNSAVPGILAWTLDRENDPCATKGQRASLVHTFKEAGFRTAWFGNQEPFSFGQGADVAEFATNTRDYHFRKDADLLPLFASFVRQAGDRQLIVLHMAGSHVPYEERYDAASRVFTPTMRDLGIAAPRPADRAAVVNSYDNTIIELDSFLMRAIAVLRTETRPALLVFTSDHGENLFDDERGLFMHAQFGPTRHDIHVPLLFWMNTPYRTAYPRVTKGLLANRVRPIGHADMFPTMLELGGISWDGADPRRSVASTSYVPATRKVRWNLDSNRDADVLH